MSVHMQPTRFPEGEVPNVDARPITGTETWDAGTVLKDDGAGNWSQITVDTDNGSIEALSLEGADSGEPDSPADEVIAARITNETYFICEVWNDGSGARVSDLSSITPGQQGDLDDTNGIYRFVDDSTTDAALEVFQVLEDHELVVVQFLNSVIA